MSTDDLIDINLVKIDADYRDRVFCLWSSALFYAWMAEDQPKQKIAIEHLAELGEAVH
jgi:hypothetical protein